MRVITRMLNRAPVDPWLVPNEYGPCACTQLRRAARKVSALFDYALQPAGLTVTQYALLVNIARGKAVSRTALAAKLGMERTTLTRNLIPLEKADLLVFEAGADRREHLLRLSRKGMRKLRHSYGLWAGAQKRFAECIGAAELSQFRTALTSAEAAAERAFEANRRKEGNPRSV
jgi:DNA-binding MarR family transcriptional regulator